MWRCWPHGPGQPVTLALANRSGASRFLDGLYDGYQIIVPIDDLTHVLVASDEMDHVLRIHARQHKLHIFDCGHLPEVLKQPEVRLVRGREVVHDHTRTMLTHERLDIDAT